MHVGSAIHSAEHKRRSVQNRIENERKSYGQHTVFYVGLVLLAEPVVGQTSELTPRDMRSSPVEN